MDTQIKMYEEGLKNKSNPELSSGGQASCSTGFPQLSEHSRNPSVSVYQLALLWEAAFSFSEFILKTLSMHLPMMGDLWVYLPTLHWVFSSFWPKTAWPPCSTTPTSFTQSRPKRLFCVCFPGWRKVLKEKCFSDGEEVKQKKWQKHKKASKSTSSKTVLSSGGKKHLRRCTASNGEYFEGDWSLSM